MDATIYRVICENTGMCYIGSTTMPLEVRIYMHERQANSNAKYHTRCRDIILGGNYKHEVLEVVSQSNLRERERHWIRQFETEAVNKNIPTDIKTENMAEYRKEYAKTHQAEKKTYNNTYYKRHKDRLTKKIDCALCGGRYCSLTKWQHEQSKRHMDALDREV